MAPTVIDTLCDLVRIPSVNPMGRDVQGPEYLETRMTEYLRRFFEQLGVPYEIQEVEPGRTNILARLDAERSSGQTPGQPGEKVLVFEAHQDTVPVDGMTIPPWEAAVRDGRVWGRGACDIKGGMACMLTAFARLAAERPPHRPTLLMACSVNEEHGFTGAQRMAQHFRDGTCSLLPRLPDAVIVAEPTLLNVVVTHKGVVRWYSHTRGRAAHSSRPEQGENAIYRMGRALQVLETYAQRHVPRLGHHPLLGTPTLSVGRIAGGISVNTVPDHCSIEIDRRLLPGDDPEEAFAGVARYLTEQLSEVAVEHERPYLASTGLRDDVNRGLAEHVAQITRKHGGPGELIGVPYGTDAPAFSRWSVPTIVFGPGSIEQAHTADEWIETSQLELATRILVQIGSTPLPA
ncbi:MAG: M20 family metallopeptidase [Pirellulaceae bacterium]|nr:M20 family metallopeptidase [Pirellulaceae bacterium]